MKHSFLFAGVLLVAQASLAAGQGQSTDTTWQKGVDATLNETQSLNFQSLQEGVRRQAEAVVGNIQPAQVAESLRVADSPAVKVLSERLEQANKRAVAAADGDMVARVKAGLPKLQDKLYRGPKSPYFTLSPQGQEVITVIRAIPHASGEKRRDLLVKIKQYSAAGLPEATNFVGVILEYGLFGARKDLSQALAMYQSAAAAGYQPALFNVANFSFYAKGGTQDLRLSAEVIQRAFTLAQDTSGRVCGLGAFLNYRAGNNQEAMKYANGCTSPVAKIPLALYSERMSPLDRIKNLRESLTTGADDGFRFIRLIADSTPKLEPQLKCRYRLLDRYRLAGGPHETAESAEQCLRELGVSSNNGRMAQDITNYVEVEARAIATARQQNQFHYSWSVPYLPFPLSEVGLFQPIIEHSQ